MATPSPVTIAKPTRSNGVLSVSASATQKKFGGATERRPSQSASRLKLVIRRLPPGLTQTEFEGGLGDEWKVGRGKVSWLSYKAGKISKDPAKPSRPSRAYVHMTNQIQINSLSDKVRNTSFVDLKGTTKDPCLLGPPSVEFAPYGRTPSGRPRKDARQGTIDQDPEFMSFLESLTNPVMKAATMDQEDESTKIKEKVTVTPLIQFIRDKKANKGKENAAAKSAKQARQDKDGKGGDGKAAAQPPQSPKKRSAQAMKVEQVARDAVKVLNKQAANTKVTSQTPTGPKPQTVTPKVVPNNAANAALANKQRERGNVKAAAQMLQRDLGLSGNSRNRGAKQVIQSSTRKSIPGNNQAATASAPATTSSPPTPQASAPNKAAAQTPANVVSISQPATLQPPTGPAANRNPPRSAAMPPAQPSSSKDKPPSSTSTQAFLKHANPSQGVTEPLLQEAFKAFGTVKHVEIDKKKGFAYVDFAEPEGLQKAIRASPIKIAQGQVQVHERKTGPQLQAKTNLRNGGPAINNNNVRGGPMIGQNNPRGGPAPPGPPRGGHGNNRGGPALGPRAGPMRGRGGAGRGGLNTSNVHRGKAGMPGATNASTTAPAVAAPVSSSTNVSDSTKGADTVSSRG
ncbi:uncharacterized protein KY384_007889 [Bacidia gigantensis]|uniref:uncharacterized protein n=1 Tax=Bacidia gigantensis TaxID=2732470 RepID=UPI001D036259|nr:uncharacterized protein KY384_007889 [Bacidia gigantensis]KAG8527735.1 hypothetical protein KY384_007889 [Bacidia gigantensis]